MCPAGDKGILISLEKKIRKYSTLVEPHTQRVWSHDSHATIWAWCHVSSSTNESSSRQLASIAVSVLAAPSLDVPSSSCWLRLVAPVEVRDVGEMDPPRVEVEVLPSSPAVGGGGEGGGEEGIEIVTPLQ